MGGENEEKENVTRMKKNDARISNVPSISRRSPTLFDY